MTTYYNNFNNTNKSFDIRDHIDFDEKGRAFCPVCSSGHKNKSKTLSVSSDPKYDGAYKCFRGCSTEEIRNALGVSKNKQVPETIAKSNYPSINEKGLVNSQKVAELNRELLENKVNSVKALKWLRERGFSLEMVEKYKLGISRVKFSKKMVYAVSIPIPSLLSDHYYIKKRVAPWDKELSKDENYYPWKQYGIPSTTYFSYLPENPTQTWLCEGEWDAIMLGWLVQKHRNDVAVACFTCGCSSVPPKEELDRLPGDVYIFYDRNDKLTKQGLRPGDEGAKKVAKALGQRGKIALVPMSENSTVKGWDISDAIRSGYQLENFEQAVCEAKPYKPEDYNSFLANSRKLSQLYDQAPDYIDWLVPGLFTSNELYCLAAEPRKGKSLFALGLAKAVASGGSFLERPCQKGEVIYVCKEDPDDKVKERLIAQSWQREEMDNVLINDNFTLDDLPELIDYIKVAKPSLLILDTLSRIQRSNARENSSEIADVLAPLQDLAQTHNVCILVVHHTRKKNIDSTELDDIFDSVRGSGAIRATCRGMLVLASSKEGFRLAVENGRTATQDLKIFLDINSLSWQLKGRWQPPNIPIDHKQAVLNWFDNYQKGSIDEIYKSTLIRKKYLYEILTRLICEGLIVRTGRQRNTIYYIVSVPQVPQSDNQKSDLNKDGVWDTMKSAKIEKKVDQRDQVDHVLVQQNLRDPFDPFDPKKSDSVEVADQGESNDVDISDAPISQTSQSGSFVELVGKKAIKGIKGDVIHFDQNSNTTNFFREKGDQETEEKEEEKTLKGVWHKEHGYLKVVEQRGSRLTVRKSGERKTFTVYLQACESRREYENHCEIDQYINYSLS